MSLRQRRYLGVVVVGAGFALAVLCWLAAAQVAAQPVPASQPAVTVVQLLDDPMALANALMQAFGNKSWPLFVVLAVGVLLFVERHFRGALGKRSSEWLGSRWGIFATSLLTTVFTAGLSAYTGGWANLGKGIIIAVALGLINGGLQWPGAKGPPSPPSP